jgi:hypothetical protein
MRRILRRIVIFVLALLVAAAVSIVGWTQWMMLTMDAEAVVMPAADAPASAARNGEQSVPDARNAAPAAEQRAVAARPARPSGQVLDGNTQSAPANVARDAKARPGAEHARPENFPDRHRKLETRTAPAVTGARAGTERAPAAVTDLRMRPAAGSEEQLLGGSAPAPAERAAPGFSTKEASTRTKPSTSKAPTEEASTKQASTKSSTEASTRKTKERLAARETPQSRSAREPAAGKRRQAYAAKVKSTPRSAAAQRDPLRAFLRSIQSLL